MKPLLVHRPNGDEAEAIVHGRAGGVDKTDLDRTRGDRVYGIRASNRIDTRCCEAWNAQKRRIETDGIGTRPRVTHSEAASSKDCHGDAIVRNGAANDAQFLRAAGSVVGATDLDTAAHLHVAAHLRAVVHLQVAGCMNVAGYVQSGLRTGGTDADVAVGGKKQSKIADTGLIKA